MQRFILALVLGFFSRSAPSHSPITPGAQLFAGAAPATLAVLAAPETLAPTRLTAPGDAAGARGTVAYRRTRLARGRVRHQFLFPSGEVVEFTDRPRGRREPARRARVLAFGGSQTAAAEPTSTFAAAARAAGLSPAAADALRFVSRHEGGFDAVNTWDSARFSWGFIQFAGGCGLPPALGHFKRHSPALFQVLLARYGVDVQPAADGRPEAVYVNSRTGAVLRGRAAEQAFGDEPLVIALFIRAGRTPEVRQRQVEAAIRHYALPALAGTYRSVPLARVLRSAQGLAMLIDRHVHEGNVGRLGRALEAALATGLAASSRPTPWSGPNWSRLETGVLDLAVQDADARTAVAALAEDAAGALYRAGHRGEPAALHAARAMLAGALETTHRWMLAGTRRERLLAGLPALLAETEPGRMGLFPAAARRQVLAAAAAQVRGLVTGLRYEYAIRNRLRAIRTSALPGPRSGA